MKFLFIDTYYPKFLTFIHQKFPNLSKESYQRQLKIMLDQCFGTSDFYSYNLRQLGIKADDIIVNDEIMQREWANENGLKIDKINWLSLLQTRPIFKRFLGFPKWLTEISLAQIKSIKPDICYVQDITLFNSEAKQIIKKYCKLLIGQIASPLPAKKYLLGFDLILTSFPHYIDLFSRMNIKSEYFRIGFDTRLLEKVGQQQKVYDVTFIGSFTPFHRQGIQVLEQVAKEIPINIWGWGLSFVSPFSSLIRNYRGEAWGVDMYKILAQSKIVINRHVDVAGDYANNMRLYESTGVGAMLITDEKKNIQELFKVGKEIETYKNAADLISKIKFYLKHDKKREQITREGQKRTLKDHTYLVRMKKLVKMVEEYL